MTDEPTNEQTSSEPTMQDLAPAEESGARPSGAAQWAAANRRVLIVAAAIVVVIVVAIISFSMSSDSGSSSSTTAAPAQSAVADRKLGPLTAEQLKAEAAKLGSLKVYWVGPVPGFTYMLTVQGGQAIVGYLPEGQPEAAVSANLQVGSYPVTDAYTVTSEAGKETNSVAEKNADGSILSYNKGRLTNVYVSFPKVDVQIELFNPNPGESLRWAQSGQVQPLN